MTPANVDAEWDDVVDRLVVHDIDYLTGGSAWSDRPSPYRLPSDAPVETLVVDMAQASHPRLQEALVALLFRHPEYVRPTVEAAKRLPDHDRARLVLYASVLAAAALRVWWSFVLHIYLPNQPSMDVSMLPAVFKAKAPDPTEDYGRPCLTAAADLLRAGQPLPFAYERAWHAAAGHVLESLRAEARRRSA